MCPNDTSRQSRSRIFGLGVGIRKSQEFALRFELEIIGGDIGKPSGVQKNASCACSRGRARDQGLQLPECFRFSPGDDPTGSRVGGGGGLETVDSADFHRRWIRKRCDAQTISLTGRKAWKGSERPLSAENAACGRPTRPNAPAREAG
ncbi:uncharacterized protein LY79DRAFT_580195 [Colletotrichum navitas]|uniref:Uncharacterized protein n=1 Tax=Colletotrichum navitas TaxID=681940 RepID=A0AAD8V545_9PEZI|nr:uncharacterized protein LY79DRAFT_580195 [Colletotrichum navitas]KAK1589999.1 hypothetical protein LY79DRAFT_580195 [Colletotrichum navitas]